MTGNNYEIKQEAKYAHPNTRAAAAEPTKNPLAHGILKGLFSGRALLLKIKLKTEGTISQFPTKTPIANASAHCILIF